MKIIINENATQADTEIVINCTEITDELSRIVSILRSFDKKLTGVKDGQTHIISPNQVLYFDTVDRRTFIYTEKEVYETPLRLYEIEDRLSGLDFFRNSKSGIINLSQVISLCPEFGGKIEVTMANKEKLSVSRQYATTLKQKLGLR